MINITIPADKARAAAMLLRAAAIVGAGFKSGDTEYKASELADMLDPPSPSLRAEVAEAARQVISKYDWNYDYPSEALALAVLAVVRRHVDDLPGRGGSHLHCFNRDDVLRLLNGGDE